MDWYENYLNKIAQTPHDSWRGLNQASINTSWQDTTQIRKIKEQSFPFTDEYTEYEVWVSTVADISVNTNKEISDFIRVLFKDINHKGNHRGQKYLYDPSGEDSWQTYLCYDTIEPLSQVADSKLVRCNNYLKWINEDGVIIKEPCFVGYELTSTNNQIAKSGTVENRRLVVMIQGNKETNKIIPNQRFILNHKSAFKITQINSFMMDDINTEEVPLLELFIEWTSILPSDDLENNLADINYNDFKISFDIDNIVAPNGYKGVINTTVTRQDNIIQSDIVWGSSNDNVITVDNDGNYEIVGQVGDTATLTCHLNGDDNIYSQLSVEVIATQQDNYTLVVSPIINSISQLDTQEFNCNVYKNGVLDDTISVICTPNWIDNDYYSLTNVGNVYSLTNNKRSNNALTLTFSADNCEDVVMTIKLKGLI